MLRTKKYVQHAYHTREHHITVLYTAQPYLNKFNGKTFARK